MRKLTGQRRINVIALDPGEVTGLAHYVCNGAYQHGNRAEESNVKAMFTALELSPDHAASYVSQVANDPRTQDSLLIGFERFVPRRRSYAHTNQPAPHRVIGSIIEIARQARISYVEQGVSEAKHVGTPAMLRKLGLWTAGRGHANDAAGHALLMLIRFHPYEASRLYRHGRLIVERTN